MDAGAAAARRRGGFPRLARGDPAAEGRDHAGGEAGGDPAGDRRADRGRGHLRGGQFRGRRRRRGTGRVAAAPCGACRDDPPCAGCGCGSRGVAAGDGRAARAALPGRGDEPARAVHGERRGAADARVGTGGGSGHPVRVAHRRNARRGGDVRARRRRDDGLLRAQRRSAAFRGAAGMPSGGFPPSGGAAGPVRRGVPLEHPAGGWQRVLRRAARRGALPRHARVLRASAVPDARAACRRRERLPRHGQPGQRGVAFHACYAPAGRGGVSVPWRGRASGPRHAQSGTQPHHPPWRSQSGRDFARIASGHRGAGGAGRG